MSNKKENNSWLAAVLGSAAIISASMLSTTAEVEAEEKLKAAKAEAEVKKAEEDVTIHHYYYGGNSMYYVEKFEAIQREISEKLNKIGCGSYSSSKVMTKVREIITDNQKTYGDRYLIISSLRDEINNCKYDFQIQTVIRQY